MIFKYYGEAGPPPQVCQWFCWTKFFQQPGKDRQLYYLVNYITGVRTTAKVSLSTMVAFSNSVVTTVQPLYEETTFICYLSHPDFKLLSWLLRFVRTQSKYNFAKSVVKYLIKKKCKALSMSES